MAQMYLYNGVELPALPAWDTETYPHAIIRTITNNEGEITVYQLKAGKSVYDKNDGYVHVETVDGDYVHSNCRAPFDSWTSPAMVAVTGRAEYDELVWTNLDIPGVMDGSDPIPVTTAAPIDPTSFRQGWLVGRRIATMRGKKTPVAYLYNGVRLPDISEAMAEHAECKYAVIASGIVGVSGYALMLSEEPFLVWMNGGIAQLSTPTLFSGYKPNASNDGWNMTVSTAAYRVAVWANHNIYYADDEGELSGTLYMAASKPVPVYA